ncbi:hypothetical protein HWV07_06965 [Natronomonas salina]|uniref:O-antigen ligase family protein n=1 Tax=Natronomonas salina TaxID=1710540 RepID=UPI0015B3D52A|nr:hypothetical protein [Natronomonas salina]QLD88789.1 hypothetical protein HWV07_06965 [Natronomonas salina]
MAVLGVAVLGAAPGGPEWIGPRQVASGMMLLTSALVVGHILLTDWTDFESDLDPYRYSVQVLLLFVLFLILSQSATAGYGLVFDRATSSLVVFLVLIGFCVLANDPRRYSSLQWLVIGCIATVAGIFFYHALSISITSSQARQPFWYGTIMAVGIVALPQYLSREQFLWAVNRFSAGLVILALPIYVIGEYTLFGMSFTFHGAYTIPVLDVEVRATRSLFVNRNAFAVVVFAGLVCAVAEFHQTVVRERPRWTLFVPVLLLGVNAAGLALSYGRALWVITPMALGVYVAYMVFGRSAVPIAVVGGFVYLVSGIAAVHTGFLWLPEDIPTRADRWYPAVAAILEQPSLLGAGFVDPGAYIAPYQGGAEWSPHNSYLTVAIRAGLLGGAAYAMLMASSLLAGLREGREAEGGASVAALALGVGFTAHQQFEAYRLFNWSSSSVLAVLVFGFLVFGGMQTMFSTSPSE